MLFATGASAQAAEELWWGERAGCGLEQPEAVVLRIQGQTVLLATQAPTLTMFAGEVSANGKVSVSGNSPQNSQIQYLFAAQKRQLSWVGTWSRTDGKSACNDGRWSASQNPSAPMTASTDTCAKALQGKIAWNYSGDTKWEPTKLEKLCGDLTHAEPAICFGRVMHGGVSWGGGTKWPWEDALTLCARTTDAHKTISCFGQMLFGGLEPKDAVGRCSL